MVRAWSGESTIEFCMSDKAVKYLVLDANIRGLNGFEVTRILRSRENVDLVIILVGWVSLSTADLAFKSGCNEFITKPLDPKVISSILKTRYVGKSDLVATQIPQVTPELPWNIFPNPAQISFHHLYYVIWMTPFQVRTGNPERITEQTLYLATGLTGNGLYHSLGWVITEGNDQGFWPSLFENWINSGVEDILMFLSDSPSSVQKPLAEFFPATAVLDNRQFWKDPFNYPSGLAPLMNQLNPGSALQRIFSQPEGLAMVFSDHAALQVRVAQVIEEFSHLNPGEVERWNEVVELTALDFEQWCR